MTEQQKEIHKVEFEVLVIVYKGIKKENKQKNKNKKGRKKWMQIN